MGSLNWWPCFWCFAAGDVAKRTGTVFGSSGSGLSLLMAWQVIVGIVEGTVYFRSPV